MGPPPRQISPEYNANICPGAGARIGSPRESMRRTIRPLLLSRHIFVGVGADDRERGDTSSRISTVDLNRVTVQGRGVC